MWFVVNGKYNKKFDLSGAPESLKVGLCQDRKV
jgi:hypothetical protein